MIKAVSFAWGQDGFIGDALESFAPAQNIGLLFPQLAKGLHLSAVKIVYTAHGPKSRLKLRGKLIT